MMKNYADMLSRFYLIPERYGQTDRQTDRWTVKIAISISLVSMLTRHKNWGWSCRLYLYTACNVM